MGSTRQKREFPGKPLSRGRRWAFRLGAFLFGLAILLLIEAGLALLDWGTPDLDGDAFVGFHDIRPLFVLDENGTRWVIDPARQAFFRPDSFARRKAEDEYRIFCLGGSTVQGRPFAVETSFTTWLELSLQAADPSRSWEVVNCGGVSYASYRLVPILKEVLEHEPDLILVYTGHNEFLEDRTYGHLKRMPRWAAVPGNALLQTRTCNLLRAGVKRFRGGGGDEGRPRLRAEVDALLDYRGGLDLYERDVRWRSDTIDHFRHNLRRMHAIARRAGVPLLFLNPVSNLRDCPPFKPQHGEDLTDADRSRCRALLARADAAEASDPRLASRLLQQAVQLDPQHAGLHYRLGLAFDRLGRKREAEREYVLAKETDVCPLRILEPMHRGLLETAEATDAWMVDVRQRFAAISRDGIPDGEHLLDHVHPSIEGHKRIASWVLEELVRRGVVQPAGGWESARDAAYRKHLQSLDDLYYQMGIERLENLRCWTRGRAEGVPGQTPATRS